MRKKLSANCKRVSIIAILIIALMLLTSVSVLAEGGEYAGKLVILHTNDVHGAIDGYAKVSALKKDLENMGADVILADAGDFIQGSAEVGIDKGASVVPLMNKAGYDVVELGNHEFDFGIDILKNDLSKASFEILCANAADKDGLLYKANTVIEKGGVKVGFYGVLNPDTKTIAPPLRVKDIDFFYGCPGHDLAACASAQAKELRNSGADIVICLSHVGVTESSAFTSTALCNKSTGTDFYIDGHSHVVMTEGKDGQPIQSTGTGFANIGVIVIDKTAKKIESNKLIAIEELENEDSEVKEIIDQIKAKVEKEYSVVVGKSEVDLNGDKKPGNRTQETNHGDLVTDAFLWYATEKHPDISAKVPKSNVVAIENGGGIRAWLNKGDITKGDLFKVMPFGNTLDVIYVKGSTLLEVLESTTFAAPDELGAFPQIAGMNITVNTSIPFDANDEPYPGSTYYGPKSIKRVTINDIGGKPFDPDALYAVATNNFATDGGEAYHIFGAVTDKISTGVTLDSIIGEYIVEKLGGVISAAEYAEPQGRIILTDKDIPTPDTADNFPVIISISVMGASVLLGTACAVKSKRKAK